MTKDEINELNSYESAVCKILYKTLKDGKFVKSFGTGFFCEINNLKIPFRKALFTNNHILDEEQTKINSQIKFEYCEKEINIIITKDRKVFTNKELDYTCIEIFDTDNINNFFNIDKDILNGKNNLINKEIFILQYSEGNLSHDSRKILDIKNNMIKYSASTDYVSSGSPLIKRNNINLIVGINFSSQKKTETSNVKDLCNLATPFDSIITDIIDKSSKNNNGIKNIIELKLKVGKQDIDKDIYFLDNTDYTEFKTNIKHFHDNLKELNKLNVNLYINDKKYEYKKYHRFKKEGIYEVKLEFKKNIKDCSFMFAGCYNIIDINFSSFNTVNVNNMQFMFTGCWNLTNLDLSSFNTKNVTNMQGMFGNYNNKCKYKECSESEGYYCGCTQLKNKFVVI